MSRLTTRLRRFGQRALGFDIARYTLSRNNEARRFRLLAHAGIDVVLDVGANEGQYADTMRNYGFTGRIESFEPGSAAFAHLARKAAASGGIWRAHQMALGATEGEATLLVGQSTECSSLLPVLDASVNAFPQSQQDHAEQTVVRRLDTLFDTLVGPRERPLLKIDVQGFEQAVLEGATGCLDRIAGVQVEVSLVPLYEGEASFEEITAFLRPYGLMLASVEPGFTDPSTGRLLQMDALYFRF